MNAQTSYNVILFKSVSNALKAEKILKSEGLPYKLIPVPKQISSDCGICLRCEPTFQDKIEAVLANKVEIDEIRMIVS